ncbi:hypothetical protein GCM10008944_23370 [Cytobacillus oceanisediminis]
MSRMDERSWTVVVYEVSGVREQQRILADFHTAAMSGVVALGTHNGSSVYVVVECRGAGDQWLVDAVVHQIDPGARCTSEHPQPAGLASVVAPADG